MTDKGDSGTCSECGRYVIPDEEMPTGWRHLGVIEVRGQPHLLDHYATPNGRSDR